VRVQTNEPPRPRVIVQLTLTFENITLTQLQRAVHMIDAAEWEDNPLEAQRNAIDPNNVDQLHIVRAWADGSLTPDHVGASWNQQGDSPQPQPQPQPWYIEILEHNDDE
jgi:hypothetical protein